MVTNRGLRPVRAVWSFFNWLKMCGTPQPGLSGPHRSLNPVSIVTKGKQMKPSSSGHPGLASLLKRTAGNRAATMLHRSCTTLPSLESFMASKVSALRPGDIRWLIPLWILMDTKSSYLTGVELNDAVAGWRAHLIDDIRSSGGLQSSAQAGMFSKWFSSSYTQPIIINDIMLLNRG